MDNVTSQYVFDGTDTNKEIQEVDPCRLEKWKGFLDRVALKSFRRWEEFELVKKRKNVFGME